ncbi:hypothetical protein ACFSFY_12865 [Sporosarcina siberiensis]|uniref:Uncharacterized protein n=1 Tax=Sporosarcina siberiensis TaxID=1365606 RepID=A0ABW4SIJ6_9BACL
MDFDIAMGIYVIGFGSLKGLLNHDQEYKVVYNFKSTSSLYKKIGFKDSLIELLSLALVLFNGYILSPDTLSPFELVVTLFILAMLYRFLFWGVTQTIKKRIVQE